MGYASNMGKCIDMKKHKLFGMKSHDCHVFMQRLIPIAFRELLLGNVWQALTEISIFFYKSHFYCHNKGRHGALRK